MSLSKNLRYGWKFYLHLLNTVPIQTKAITSGTLSYLASVITQKFFEKQPKMDHMRALKFVIYAFLQTTVSHYWYKFLDSCFKDNSATKGSFDSSAIKKLLLDELLYDPFCIVFFFTIVGLLERKTPTEIIEKIRRDWWPTQNMSWKIWPLFQLINFMLIPGHLRILFVNFVSFFWGIFLQMKAARK